MKEQKLSTTRLQEHINLLFSRYPRLLDCKDGIIQSYKCLEEAYSKGGKLLVAGNGGSAADSEHIVGELMKRFKISRPIPETLASRLIEVDNMRGPKLASELEAGLPAIALTSHLALSTAVINDTGGEFTFAQQLISLGISGDVFLGISTSGNSKNVMNAAVVAKALNILVVALTGANGGELASIADVSVRVPETETYIVQELHLPIYHTWCLMLEDRFFGSDFKAAD